MSRSLLFTGGRIVTGRPGPGPEALAVIGDRIAVLGDRSEVVSALPGPAEVVDLAGGCLLPGIVDCHIHLAAYGLSLGEVDVDTGKRGEAVDRVRMAVDRGESFIIGGGWNKNLWSDEPDRYCLDAVTDRPVVLYSKDHHALWVNGKVLELAGIGADTPDPPGGVIVRDQRGEPTGILLETACDLVYSVMPGPDRPRLRQACLDAQARLHELGVVGVHNCEDLASLEALSELAQDNRLSLNVTANVPPGALDLPNVLTLPAQAGVQRLRLGGVKVFADGALGSQTADMLAPYSHSDNRGVEVTGSEELLKIGIRARTAGWPLVIHAIGDRAVTRALDVIASVGTVGSRPHRIEHAQLIDPDDIGRFADMGVVASMQPIHAPSDRDVADRYWGDRVSNAYPWRTLLDSGAVLAFGSDAPVESPDPVIGLASAVSRTIPGSSRPPWHPEQCVSLAEAVSAYTRGAAAAIGDREGGRLEAGAVADMTILASDPFADPEAIGSTAVAMTVAAGRIVYSRHTP